MEEKHYWYQLPEKYRPVTDIEIYRDGNSYLLVCSGNGEDEPPYIEGHFFPKINDDGDIEEVNIRYVYPTHDIFATEVEDARVGYDGKVHATVGAAIRSQINELVESGLKPVAARLTEVTVLSSAWEGADGLYSQVVEVADVTEYSKVDLLPSVEQLAIFHNKDVAFVTENDDGVITVFAIGDKPTLDYTMQAQITEVEV